MLCICWHGTMGQPLMDKRTQEVSYTKMFKYAEIKTWSFILPNGVTLVMRPADSVKNILISGFANGGAAGLPAADYVSAEHAGSIIGRSGVGNYNAAALDSILKGKSVRISASINDNLSSISGSCAKNDLETALQLIYLYFTAPRCDTAACNQYVQQLKTMAAKMPDSPMEDTLNQLRYGHDARHQKLATAVNSISPGKVMASWQRCFGNARGYTFVFTGDLDPNGMNHSRLEPLVSRYLGALPSTPESTGRPPLTGITPVPAGGIIKTIHSGTGSNARAQIVFNGDYAATDSANLQLKALTWILHQRVLSDAKNAGIKVLSANTFSLTIKRPKPGYEYHFNFVCPAQHMQPLLKLMHAVTDSLQQQVPADLLQAYVTMAKGQLRQQFTDNGFWTTYLIRQFIKQDDPYDIAHYPYFFRKATPETLRQTANMMWRNKPYIEMVQYPLTNMNSF